MKRPLLALFLFCSALPAQSVPGKVIEDELAPQGKKDDPIVYAVYTPRAYTGEKAVPLVLAIHAGTRTARSFATFLRPLAEGQGALVVCPQGFEEVIGAGGYWWKGDKTEMAALTRLLAHVKKTWKIDDKRITLVGLADGAELGLRWALSRDRGLQGVIALNFLWKWKSAPRTKQEIKVCLFASEKAMEKLESLKQHAEKAQKLLAKAKYPVVLRIMPGSSRSFFHRWDEEFSKAYEWFDGKRDWPKELAAESTKPGKGG